MIDLAVPRARPQQGGFGAKALYIFAFCSTPISEQRFAAFEAICALFAGKSVKLKMLELASRGYLHLDRGQWAWATLTERGRRALESQPHG